MRKRRIFICSFCVLFIALIIWGIKMFHVYDSNFSNIYIFADIQECQAMEALSDNGGKFTKYQDAGKDKYSKDLSYTAFFGGEYCSSKCEFEICAYEFEDTVAARKYFDRVTGKNSYTMDKNFSLSSGLIHSQLVVFEKNKAYAMSFPTSVLYDVAQIMVKYFTVKVI